MSAREGEPVQDFPTLNAEQWVTVDEPLGWGDATSLLGVSRSALRRALDEARAEAGPSPTVVHGICGEYSFRAVRPTARRGVAWRFHVSHGHRTLARKVSDLRGKIAQTEVESLSEPRQSAFSRLRNLFVRQAS